MLLFVYGTLRSGFTNTFRQIMESQSSYIGEGTIRGRLYDLGNYPGLILSDALDALVHGQVYHLHHDSLIKELDLYENYRRNDSSSLFIRSEQPIIMAEGKSINAFVYTYNKSIDNAIRISDGDYRVYLDGKKEI